MLAWSHADCMDLFCFLFVPQSFITDQPSLEAQAAAAAGILPPFGGDRTQGGSVPVRDTLAIVME